MKVIFKDVYTRNIVVSFECLEILKSVIPSHILLRISDRNKILYPVEGCLIEIVED